MKSDAGPCVFAVFFAASILAYAAFATENSSVLWEIVRDRCAAPPEGERQYRECDYVDAVHRYAVLKDRVGELQYLLIPTERITGIESPAILATDAENYWQDAWLARRFLEQRAEKPVPRDYIALAINSSSARSQNQLHIHIDCVRPDVKEALSRSEGQIGAQWTPLGTPLRGHQYLAKRLEAEESERGKPVQGPRGGRPFPPPQT